MIRYALVDTDHPLGLGHYILKVPNATTLPDIPVRYLVSEHVPQVFETCHGVLAAGSLEDYILAAGVSAVVAQLLVGTIEENFNVVRNLT